MEWTDESIARLRALWQEGLSTAEIGRRMGITKNAVVGKAHRLDLSARPSPIRKTEPQAGAVQPQPKRSSADKPRSAEPSAETQSVAPPPTVSVQQDAVVPVPPRAVAVEPPFDTAEPDAAPVAIQPPPAPAAAEPAPAEPEPVGNVRLLRPDMPNPAVPSAAPRDAAEPVRAEAARPAARTAEPREPRRRGLTCCWPLGEPGTKGFHFCGGDPTPGKPYCAEHAALAYVKLRDRRDSVA